MSFILSLMILIDALKKSDLLGFLQISVEIDTLFVLCFSLYAFIFSEILFDHFVDSSIHERVNS